MNHVIGTRCLEKLVKMLVKNYYARTVSARPKKGFAHSQEYSETTAGHRTFLDRSSTQIYIFMYQNKH